MEPLDRYLTCIIKDLKSIGVLETLHKHMDMEYIIKKGFEIMADAAIIFLRNIIGNTFPFFKSSSSYRNSNSIFDVIYNLIDQFCPEDFKTIIQYIKAAIDLLYKLLRRKSEETFHPNNRIIPIKETPYRPSTPKNTDNKKIGLIQKPKIYPVEETMNSRHQLIRPSTPKNTDKKEIELILEARAKFNPEYSFKEEESMKIKISLATKTNTTRQNCFSSEAATDTRRKNNKNTIPRKNTPKITNTKNIVHTEEAKISPVKETKNTYQNKAFIGTNATNNSNFKGVKGERKIWYYVGCVALSSTEQSITNYLRNTIPNGKFECRKLTSKGRMQSFKLIANFSSKEELENPANWPEGVKVRPWINKEKLPPKPQTTL